MHLRVTPTWGTAGSAGFANSSTFVALLCLALEGSGSGLSHTFNKGAVQHRGQGLGASRVEVSKPTGAECWQLQRSGIGCWGCSIRLRT